MPEDPSERAPRSGSGEIATTTLAEIYAQQGLLGRALTIYRRMLARSPDDETLANRIRALERRVEESEEPEAAERPGAVERPAEAEPPTTADADPGSEAPTAPAPPRERLPWDPPEETAEPVEAEEAREAGEEAPAAAADARPASAVGPIDRRAFEAWLEAR